MALIIFDLDGTLVDSRPDLVRTVNAAMAEYGFARVGPELVTPWVGRGSRVLLAAALRHHGVDPQAPGFDFEAAFERFLYHYGQNLTIDTTLYPSVGETLAELAGQGYALAVCTNKPERFVAPLLKHFGILDRFGALLGGDSLAQRKPDPEPLLHLARHFSERPERCAMVGDSRHDVEAARGAGMPVAGLRGGYGSAEEFQLHPPDILIDTLAELPAWLSRTTIAA